jgi:hypothetical protein
MITDIAKQRKGYVSTVHDAITATATSGEINCTGFNSILVEVAISGGANNWTFALTGCLASGGTFVPLYEQANTGSMVAMSYQCDSSRTFLFRGIPDYVKVVATEDVNGSTVTVKVQPLNV